MFEFLKRVSSWEHSHLWAAGLLGLDTLLTLLIIWKIPFTDIDWSTYMEQVDVFLSGQTDYSLLRGSTGPIAYPWAHVYIFGVLRWCGTSVLSAQLLFAATYIATMGVVFSIYRSVHAPGWLLALCVLSKRVHSIFVLRLFNDGLAQFLLYVSILLLVRRKHVGASVAYSCSVAIKAGPILFCPAFGLCLVLSGGWAHALLLVALMVAVQVVGAIPFLANNPGAYLRRAFGGPGALQQVWSVNWRFLPPAVFSHPLFPLALLFSYLIVLCWFAHCRWTPRGLVHHSLWRWRTPPGDVDLEKPKNIRLSMVIILFSCNFVGIACLLRTMHFQFLVWYFHTVPLLAWYGLQPDAYSGWRWGLRVGMVAALTLAIEVPFLLTTTGRVQGPDGRAWDTPGVPWAVGSVALQSAHACLLLLLAARRNLWESKEDSTEERSKLE